MYYKRLDQLPTVPFYAIVTEQSISVPGDRRSEEAPGHGYPAHTVHAPEIQYFDDKTEWLEALTTLANATYKKSYRAFRMHPVSVSTEVKVNLDEEGDA